MFFIAPSAVGLADAFSGELGLEECGTLAVTGENTPAANKHKSIISTKISNISTPQDKKKSRPSLLEQVDTHKGRSCQKQLKCQLYKTIRVCFLRLILVFFKTNLWFLKQLVHNVVTTVGQDT